MHRTTIEIDDALIDEAKRVLGTTTIRATVEEALRRSVQAGRDAAHGHELIRPTESTVAQLNERRHRWVRLAMP